MPGPQLSNTYTLILTNWNFGKKKAVNPKKQSILKTNCFVCRDMKL